MLSLGIALLFVALLAPQPPTAFALRYRRNRGGRSHVVVVHDDGGRYEDDEEEEEEQEQEDFHDQARAGAPQPVANNSDGRSGCLW